MSTGPIDPPAPTRLVCEAAALLGAPAPGASLATARDETVREPITLDTAAGEATLIVGPSGSGKTTLLRELATAADEAGRRVVRVGERLARRRSTTPVIDVVARAVAPNRSREADGARIARDAMRLLARAGLAELRTAGTRVGKLSQGERARLEIALALAALERATRQPARTNRGGRVAPALLLIDELASNLDDAGGVGLACLLAREIARLGAHAVIATHRPGLAAHMPVRTRIAFDGAGRSSVQQLDGSLQKKPLDGIRFGLGGPSDYEALAPLHYRPGRPAVIDRVLVARDEELAGSPVAGVLIVAMPALNAAYRAGVWPDLHGVTNTRRGAQRLNAELRCIARVIVEPRYRARGLSSALVRTYLSSPITPRTEAIAAMGLLCPFFERAGMRPHGVPRAAHHDRLLDAIEQCGVSPGNAGSSAWRLTTPGTAFARLFASSDPHRNTFFESELRRWDRVNGGRHDGRDRSLRRVFDRAALALLSDPVAYTHDARDR